jgi:hypothetical protein
MLIITFKFYVFYYILGDKKMYEKLTAKEIAEQLSYDLPEHKIRSNKEDRREMCGVCEESSCRDCAYNDNRPNYN